MKISEVEKDTLKGFNLRIYNAYKSLIENQKKIINDLEDKERMQTMRQVFMYHLNYTITIAEEFYDMMEFIKRSSNK